MVQMESTEGEDSMVSQSDLDGAGDFEEDQGGSNPLDDTNGGGIEALEDVIDQGGNMSGESSVVGETDEDGVESAGTRDFATSSSEDGGCGTGCKVGASVGSVGVVSLALVAAARWRKKDEEDDEDEDDGNNDAEAAEKGEAGYSAEQENAADTTLPTEVDAALGGNAHSIASGTIG